MSNKQVKNATFSEAVLLRPKMYTLGGTFEEAIAFLEGYYSGMAKANPCAAPVAEWVSFQHWLSDKLNVPSSEIFARVREMHSDSLTSSRKMAEWLSKFQEESFKSR